MIIDSGSVWNWAGPLLLAVMFLISGLFDAQGLKRKGLACVTWSMGLVALALWIASGLTPARICAAAAVFVSGLALMTAYYWGWPRG